jgi:hypothetical protein
MVVVSDLIGSGSAQEKAIAGETPNLARLQGIAEPNTVVISESTRRLLGNLFELEEPWGQRPRGHRRTSAGLDGAATGAGREPRAAGSGGAWFCYSGYWISTNVGRIIGSVPLLLYRFPTTTCDLISRIVSPPQAPKWDG